jgi:hypothetical protein
MSHCIHNIDVSADFKLFTIKNTIVLLYIHLVEGNKIGVTDV